MRKASLTAAVAVMAGVVCGADSVSDNFDRVDTPYEKGGDNIGKIWKSDGPVSWAIKNNMLVADYTALGEYVLYCRSFKTVSEKGQEFEISGDVAVNFANGWAGIAFHYQDPNNFYAIRFNTGKTTYQFIRVRSGEISGIVSKTDAIKPFSAGTAYNIKVTSSEPHTIMFEITEAGDSTVLNPTRTGIDPSRAFAKGYAGFYLRSARPSDKPDAMYDNFSFVMR